MWSWRRFDKELRCRAQGWAPVKPQPCCSLGVLLCWLIVCSGAMAKVAVSRGRRFSLWLTHNPLSSFISSERPFSHRYTMTTHTLPASLQGNYK